MSADSIIVIERRAKLSVDTKRLCVSGADGKKRFIAGCDIAALILAHPAVEMSSAVLKILADNGAIVLITDERFMPSAITLPLYKNLAGARRPHQQAKLLHNPELAGKLWNNVIRSKIYGQAMILVRFDLSAAKALRKLAANIRAGDENNCEGVAAKLYWSVFFSGIGKETGREKQGATDIANSCLNYGYAVLRSAVSRSLCTAGFCLNFGVGHCRKDNPCNLADDFIEPFRYLAEEATIRTLESTPMATELNSALKRELITQVLQSEVRISGKNYRLFSAIEQLVESFGKFLTDNRRNLQLPNLPKTAGRPVKAKKNDKSWR